MQEYSKNNSSPGGHRSGAGGTLSPERRKPPRRISDADGTAPSGRGNTVLKSALRAPIAAPAKHGSSYSKASSLHRPSGNKSPRRKRSRSFAAVCASVSAALFLVIVFLICFFTVKPRLELVGGDSVTAEVFEEYTDEGFSAKHLWFNLGKKVVCTSDVNTDVLGDYTVSYHLEYHGKEYSVQRRVTVKDTVPPEIMLEVPPEQILVSSMDFYEEPGYFAKDNYDGDLTERVEVTREGDGEKGICILTYKVSDLSGNEASAERVVTVKDTVAPVLTLSGGEEITVDTPSFNDPGWTATDDLDGDISSSVQVTSDYQSGAEGDFTFNYSVSDAAGNTAEAKRIVHVKDTVAPVVKLNGDTNIKIGLGEAFDDPGASASDAFEGDLSAKITVSSLPDTSAVGKYYVKYYAEDSKGNGGSATRCVTVFRRPKILNVGYISQNPSYPNGCESVSAVMALRYAGVDISVDTFIDRYLPMGEHPTINGTGPDPNAVYCGNPRSRNGWGCTSAVIAGSLNRCAGGSCTIAHSYSKSLEELCYSYIDYDIPVIVWATIDMIDSSADRYYAHWTTADGVSVSYNRKLHCLLLVGYDDDYYYFNDPRRSSANGWVRYPKRKAETAYQIMGQQSIAVGRK